MWPHSHDDERNKPDAKDNDYDSICVRRLEEAKVKRRRVKRGFPARGLGGAGEWLLSGRSFSSPGDGCMTTGEGNARDAPVGRALRTGPDGQYPVRCI